MMKIIWISHWTMPPFHRYDRKKGGEFTMSARKSVLDDGFQSYLTEGAKFVGEPGIPMLMDLKNAQIPKALVPFGKIGSSNTRQYVHFYQFDNKFSRVLTATDKYLDRLKMFDGVVTPDCSILIGQARCLQQATV